MPDPTPIPVRIVGLGEAMYAYADKAEEFARLSLWAGVLSAFVIAALLTAIVVVAGLRR